MSVVKPIRGDAGSGVATHLQCPLCGNFAKSHAFQLSHIASAHPTYLDGVAMGRLGNIVMYQSGARLFHCAECFFTSRDFNKLYQHIISKHCLDETTAAEGAGVEDNGSEKLEKEADEKVKEIDEDVKEVDEEVKEAVEEMMEVSEDVKEVKEVHENLNELDKELKELDEELKELDKELKELDEEVKEVDEELKEVDEEVDGEVKEEDKELKEVDGEVKEEDGDINEIDKDMKGANEEDDAAPQSPKEVKDEDATSEMMISDVDNCVLVFDGDIYHCLICGWWKNKLKGSAITHVVRKHNIPREFASQRIRQDDPASTSTFTPKRLPSSGADEEDDDPLSGDLLKEEMEATAKVVRFSSNRYVCIICGWKNKMKGFTISHVVRSHDVPRPYSCKDCKCTFFLPSRLRQHIRRNHRPGRYACPFCCFRSQFLSGFRRHCSRCTAREEGEAGLCLVLDEEGREPVVVKEETKETRAGRKRARRLIEEAEDEDELMFF
ncbi:uncharacterized protein LOC144014414 [Festucalex cinctus]